MDANCHMYPSSISLGMRSMSLLNEVMSEELVPRRKGARSKNAMDLEERKSGLA